MGRFDLTDGEWAVIAPLLPGADGRPRMGRPRGDDRRVLDAIFYVLRTGLPLARPAAPLRPAHDRLQPLQPLGQGGRLGPRLRGARGALAGLPAPDRRLRGPRPPARRGRKRGAEARGVGRTRGGLATKLRVLADAFGRPTALALAPGQTADNLGLRLLIGGVPEGGHLVGDRGYAAAWARGLIRGRGATPHIPSLANRAVRESVSPGIYRARNAVERLSNRLKHFRRVATRYDKDARSYLAAVTLAAIRLWAKFESTT